ncbi:DUF397 domain-containing protein [Lentzea tibetensis]|uniref:DUF397 domain-containing protein n=1 Tax=Lentzea tibetensis TaxID=2591470 RepID=A0A563EGM3_9PSEU|nr:DUF397 domain-containing protein [Lentzea tibetensis]TWP45438.1 DUF397 domain-containing protein [Lentzea tibetensis]
MPQDCVWRKSSYTSADSVDSECVEVAFSQAVRVRDSKDATGPQLRFSASAWRAFVKADRVS